MTATITVSCPEGIVLTADKKIVYTDPYGNFYQADPNPRDKIYGFIKVPIGASCWGHYWGKDFGSNTIIEILRKFEKTQIEKNDDVNIVAKKLTSYLLSNFPNLKDRMGIHLAGYCKSKDGLYTQLRHVFHEHWHDSGEFENENSNKQLHYLGNGAEESFSYTPFTALFNGDNTIANLFFNFLPTIYPHRKRKIILELLSLNECIKLAKLVIFTSSHTLDFLTEMDKRIEEKKKEIKGLMIATVTKKHGFKLIEDV